ncbi:hypothetical protein [Psychromicrobium lacuslunae]|uniref:Uncharacterized protein n=1 Tax=Psychromicrobium lacuslunae TaxID=1618207 RepID=A0A0D4C178_9MICC|nr:hypothetical protein [Psychromicrobium lacuslunae]AJT42447.1 hypothetical protein UM93_14805 [Psychromicrobium lacuslunae]
MVCTTSNLTIGQLKDSLSTAINSASYGQERVGITKPGKLDSGIRRGHSSGPVELGCWSAGYSLSVERAIMVV